MMRENYDLTVLQEEDDEPPGTLEADPGLLPERLTSGMVPSPEGDLCRLDAPAFTSAPPIRPVPHAFSGDRALFFRRRFFPGVSAREWNDWKWQMRNSFRDLDALGRVLALSPEERESRCGRATALPVRITPHYASLLDPADPLQPLRRCVVPVSAECLRSPGEEDDPLGEEADSPCPGLVHRYPDRALFLATGTCATYCRYCTRSRLVGRHGKTSMGRAAWEKAIAYIEATPAVRDVVVSGGDPLTLSDDQLAWLLGRLRQIPHVEMLRLGTKVPMVLPQRITRDLVKTLKRFHPLWMSLHVTHPQEITPEVRKACERLADAGIPLGSQTVLLAGVNDDVPTLRSLCHELLRIRVRPYYLYQCDPIPGSSHFRTDVSRGLEIIQGLRGHTSGYAVPHYVIDAPGGGGKITLLPNAVTGWDDRGVSLVNYEGKTFRYPSREGGYQEAVQQTAPRPETLSEPLPRRRRAACSPVQRAV